MSGLFEHNRLLSAKEVAHVLNVKPSTVLSWVHSGFIPFVKFGTGKKSPVRFNPKVLNQWIERNSKEMKPNAEGQKQQKQKTQPASKKTIMNFNEFIDGLTQTHG